MKQYRNKTFFVISMAWGFVISYSAYSRFKWEIRLNGPNFNDFFIFLGVIVLVCAYLTACLFWFKLKSRLTWSQFMKIDIDSFDEDERTVILDNKTRRKSGSVIASVIVLLVGFFTLIYVQKTYSLLQIMILGALVFSAYHVMNYISVKAAYNTDTLPLFLDKVYLVPFGVTAVVLLGYFGIHTLMSPVTNTTNTVVSVLAMIKTDDSAEYTRVIEGYRSLKDEQTIIVQGNAYYDFLRISYVISDTNGGVLLVYDGDLNQYKNERDQAFTQNNSSLSTFYGTLKKYKISFSDYDRELAILTLINE